jgi:hypothetical protein
VTSTEHRLARHFSICCRQLYNWRVGGMIPYFKVEKAVRFQALDVEVAFAMDASSDRMDPIRA